jgi:(1->4)-alpha-D-glucan 1-alpha-D-glucosylmutase
MAGDIDGLARLLKRISSRDRHAADFTLYGLRRALVEVLTFFPVYRSYVNQESVGEADRAYLSQAIRKSKEANPGLLLELNFIERFLLLRFDAHSEEEKREWIHFVMRFQQLTGPLMAKGFEDTTLYVYNRLLAVNEVGGDPDRFGVSLLEFHRFAERRRQRWPYAMNATASHDTKRGEDARARLAVISEIPEQWEEYLHAWSRMNRGKKSLLHGEEMPDRNDEYFLYQTLLGAYPLSGAEEAGFVERVKAYIIKSVREAKVHTEWLKPDLGYEEAYLRFVEAILDPADGNRFPGELRAAAEGVAFFGMINSLAQLALKVLAPGVPDFYQGTELWDLSFVDPDNRRPVDYAMRQRLLEEMQSRASNGSAGLIDDLLAHWRDGRVKLFLTEKALNFRREHAQMFLDGAYLPLDIDGPMQEHVCAFARRHEGRWLIAAVPRLLAGLVPAGEPRAAADIWGSAALPLPEEAPRVWHNVLTGTKVTTPPGGSAAALLLRSLFEDFPVALLYGGENAAAATAARQAEEVHGEHLHR